MEQKDFLLDNFLHINCSLADSTELLIWIKLTFPVNYKAFQFQPGAFFVIEKIVFADNANPA